MKRVGVSVASINHNKYMLFVMSGLAQRRILTTISDVLDLERRWWEIPT
jgi:hypothetical protein